MTRLIRALSEQVATVNPSPSAVAIERAATEAGPAVEIAKPVRSPPPAASVVSDQPMLDAMKAAAEQIESYLKSSGRQLQFSVDEDTGRTVITVRDSVTGEIVRQIPGDEALRLAHSLGSQTNVLVDISI